jgi:benzodiazapine receptor
MDLIKLIITVGVSQLAGLIGSIFTAPAIPTWYASLQKPAFAPPNWVFAPVWTTLFLLMGIAAYLVWKRGLAKKEVRIALGLFLFQLVLNIFWSFLFFGLQNPLAAFVEIIVLWLAILLTLVSFYRISKPAGLLLLPYLIWVSFAAFLNFQIFTLNY